MEKPPAAAHRQQAHRRSPPRRPATAGNPMPAAAAGDCPSVRPVEGRCGMIGAWAVRGVVGDIVGRPRHRALLARQGVR